MTATAAPLLGLTVALVAARAAPALLEAWGLVEARWSPPALVALAVALGVWLARRPAGGAAVGQRGGLALVVGGAALLAVGGRAGDGLLVALALPPVLLGGATLLDPRAGRLWPAALLLLASIPPPPALSHLLVQELKARAAGAAALVVSLGGTPAWHADGAIRVPGGELRVIDACSGARTYAALLAASALWLHLRPGGRAARLTVLAACLPVAFLVTVLRLATLAIAVDVHGPRSDLYLALHEVLGLLVVVPGVLLLVAVQRGATALEGPPPAGSAPPRPAPRGARPVALAALLGALAVGLAPAPACACRTPSLPAAFGGTPARAVDDLRGARLVDADDLRSAAFGPSGRGLNVAVLHEHGLGSPRGIHARAAEWVPPFCQATLRAEPIALDDGTPALRLLLARDRARRLALAVWLDADGRPAGSTLHGAWLRAVGRALRGESPGGTLVVLWSDDLLEGGPDLEAEAAKARQLLSVVVTKG